MNIGLALVFGVLYWLATNKLWYGTLHLVRHWFWRFRLDLLWETWGMR